MSGARDAARPPLGVVLAGGRSRRYGEPKAFVELGGQRIIDRVLRALGAAASKLVVVANEPEAYRPLGLPVRPDERPGNGVLGGIHTALGWAAQESRSGALVVACDMPFLSAALLRRIVGRAAVGDPDLVAPSSRGPRGVEPLCAWYGPRCRAAIEEQLRHEDRRVIGFWGHVSAVRLPLEEVVAYGDPAQLFMNVNTPADRDEAEARLRAEAAAGAEGRSR